MLNTWSRDRGGRGRMSFLRRPSSSSSLEPSLIFSFWNPAFWNPTLHRTQKTLTSITPPSISLVRRCVSQLAIPLAVLLAVLVVVLLASLCRGSARLSLSWFCSPLPARLIPSTVAVPGSPIPSLAVTPAVARSPPRNSPVTRSRTPKPSPVVLLETHPSPVVLRGSCSRYLPPRTTALMLAFSEHLRDNYSLVTYGCDYTFYDHNHPEELPLELKHSFKIVVADPPYLVRVKLIAEILFGSAILGFLLQWSGALALGWPKGHATKLTSFQESNSEIQTSCSDIAKSTMDITKIQKEEAKIVAWESQQKAK
ncbi:Protein-lysine N-methyltransferase [Arachis hypogaea]|nr:Protein-lysine N-methyltransferase [Arachis hypogaea]